MSSVGFGLIIYEGLPRLFGSSHFDRLRSFRKNPCVASCRYCLIGGVHPKTPTHKQVVQTGFIGNTIIHVVTVIVFKPINHHITSLIKYASQFVGQTVQVVQFLFRHGDEFVLGKDLLQAEERIVPRFATSHTVAARNGLCVLALFKKLFLGEMFTFRHNYQPFICSVMLRSNAISVILSVITPSHNTFPPCASLSENTTL